MAGVMAANTGLDTASSAPVNTATTTTPSDGAVGQNSTAASDVEMENQQACFTGLPPELRLRIYEYLFSGSRLEQEEAPESQESTAPTKKTRFTWDDVANSAAQRQEKGRRRTPNAPHSCCMPLFEADRDEMQATPLPLICTCWGRTFPAILRVNKLIHVEAMPVFYGNVEVRARLPNVMQSEHASAVFDELLTALPNSSLKYVSTILLCQTAAKIGFIIHVDDDPMEADFGPMWEKLCSDMPNVKHVRVRFEMNWDIYMNCFEFDQFSGLARLPNVRSVQVQLSDPDYDAIREKMIHGGSLADFMRKMSSTIENEAEKLGKQLKVSVTEVVSPQATASQDAEGNME
ncbi:hypothetical protein PRZ48_011614 [Zasmidium cellare]|uniref:Uncharacterized protein n=1 Tax=Zasmidium cellare TaxID=395010 RepID=A0ABR0E6V3_ZASCE|nr:hypothetical protein PRZ48_011614 [Zasmidium cellare]